MTAPTVQVFALPTGQLSHPDRWIFEDGDDDWMGARHTYPDYSFLIRHPSGQNVMFDLGLTKNPSLLPTVIRASAKYINPTASLSAGDLLSTGPVSPSSISTIILSHLHFDHVGDVTEFPNVAIVAGPGSRAAASPGWPHDDHSPFPAAMLEHPGYRELSFETDTWIPFGPFARAHDFFGDGSLWLVDAPGHMGGHLAAVARTDLGNSIDPTNPIPGDTASYVLLGGDCAHHHSILTDTRPMSVTVGPPGTSCFHRDPATAKETLSKIRELKESGNVLVALAHDHFLVGRMPEYPERINGWRGSLWVGEVESAVAGSR